MILGCDRLAKFSVSVSSPTCTATSRRLTLPSPARNLAPFVVQLGDVIDRQRSYAWVDTVPSGMTVVVGHDVTASARPEQVRGRHHGGTVVRQDTGSWRRPGEPLCCLDIALDEL